jgi:hypothetical protein
VLGWKVSFSPICFDLCVSVYMGAYCPVESDFDGRGGGHGVTRFRYISNEFVASRDFVTCEYVSLLCQVRLLADLPK